MGAGQIGGIATLLDIDFDNPANFIGRRAESTEGQYIVTYLSHALLFCAGALIEAHVVLTPAICVFGERYKFDVFAGSHKFLEGAGISRQVHHMCLHRGYNQSKRWEHCSINNIALLVLNHQFSFNVRESGAEYILNRLRYGVPGVQLEENLNCHYFGWGSRRNGYLIPLLIDLRRVDITILPKHKCPEMWISKGAYLCIQQPLCKSDRYGALCPDDVGSVISCAGFAQGMMTSRLVDRPCGVGFIDLTKQSKFLTCGVDDSRDVIEHDDHMAVEFTERPTPSLLTLATYLTDPTESGAEYEEAGPAEKKEVQTSPEEAPEPEPEPVPPPEPQQAESEEPGQPGAAVETEEMGAPGVPGEPGEGGAPGAPGAAEGAGAPGAPAAPGEARKKHKNKKAIKSGKK